jgi:hypothetical protein
MHPVFRPIFFLLPLAGAILSGCSSIDKPPPCTVRFHVEVQAAGADPFSVPINLQNPKRQVFVESSPALTERHIREAFVFPAEDGTWGAAFRLDQSGRITLTQMSTANRGRGIVAYVGNGKFARQISEDIYIDRPVLDGIMPIPRGLTYAEAMLLQKSFQPNPDKKSSRDDLHPNIDR